MSFLLTESNDDLQLEDSDLILLEVEIPGVVVRSVPFMPERAWTTCVSEGCISGLARSNYVPFAPQPTPPGMSEAQYEALDPGSAGFGAPPPLDCFPRYVMWREDRRPDFDGGEERINWSRNPGWDFRNDCAPIVVPQTTIGGRISMVANGAPACPGTTVRLVNDTTPTELTTVTNGSGDYLFTNPAGFVQDDQWHIRIDPGDDAPPCTSGDLPVSSSPPQTFNELTAMTQDLDIPGL